MSTIKWFGENAIMVKAPTPYLCIMLLSLCTVTFENALAACELRGKTIKEQPMCHGVEYAGSNALAIRSQGPPESFTPVVHHLCPHSNHGSATRPPTRSTIAEDSNEHWSCFDPLMVKHLSYCTFYAYFIIALLLGLVGGRFRSC